MSATWGPRIAVGLDARNGKRTLQIRLRGEFRTSALGLEMDASGFGMGTRSKRFALYAEDGVVRDVFVEAPGEFRVSSAEHMLAQLPG